MGSSVVPVVSVPRRTDLCESLQLLFSVKEASGIAYPNFSSLKLDYSQLFFREIVDVDR